MGEIGKGFNPGQPYNH